MPDSHLARSRIQSETDDQKIPHDPSLDRLLHRLKKDTSITDAEVDSIFPVWSRELSRVHWTPLEVTRRVIQLFEHSQNKNAVLDVGSGVGKFCTMGALLSQKKGEADYTGIEQRAHFVDIARQISSHYKISGLTFIHGNLQDLDWSRFQNVYLFNPFQENKTPEQRLDSAVPLSRELHQKYVQTTLAKLETLRIGSRVVTYHGFGGDFSPSYTRKISEWCSRGPLELWIKTR